VKRAVDLGSRVETRVLAIRRPTSLDLGRSRALAEALNPGVIRSSDEMQRPGIRAVPWAKWSLVRDIRRRAALRLNSGACRLSMVGRG
jgi:hypothetical protein